MFRVVIPHSLLPSSMHALHWVYDAHFVHFWTSRWIAVVGMSTSGLDTPRLEGPDLHPTGTELDVVEISRHTTRRHYIQVATK